MITHLELTSIMFEILKSAPILTFPQKGKYTLGLAPSLNEGGLERVITHLELTSIMFEILKPAPILTFPQKGRNTSNLEFPLPI